MTRRRSVVRRHAVACLLILGGAAASAQAQIAPVLKRCAPHAPVGRIRGAGAVSFRIAADGRVDSATIRVVRAEGISEAGVLSAAQRFFPGCHYAPARQQGRAVAVTVEQPLNFPVSGPILEVPAAEGAEPLEELPAAISCQAASVQAVGSLMLTFVIDVDGRANPASVEIAGPPLEAVSRDMMQRIASMCRYAPARRRGVPVPWPVSQRFVFE